MYYYNLMSLKWLTNPFAVAVPDSSYLVTLLNPKEGDGFVNENREEERSGYIFTIRKGHFFHDEDAFTYHPANATELVGSHSIGDTVELFQTHKYFISYDAYSMLPHIAAMCGCIAIVVPVLGVSKYELFMRSFLGPYMRAYDLPDIQGIAYGYEEVEYAEATMEYAREELFHVMKWNKEYILKRFVNDVQSFEATGRRPSHVKLARDIFPRNWEKLENIGVSHYMHTMYKIFFTYVCSLIVF